MVGCPRGVPMKVYVKGVGAVSLGQRDFLATGGEASVYAKGSTAYKVYTDPRKMIPVGKITDLANLTDPCIVKPEQVVTDKAGKGIGYTMAYVKAAYALCQLFPRAFRERNGLTPEQMVKLVQKLRDGVEHVHHRHVLVVDLNEMNFLVSKTFEDLWFIDVDSYQTLSYPATALMESVRDRHMAPGDFTTLTDWFSFGIVSFQMLTGIHPFKGKHPRLKGFDARMKANVSVFSPDVKVPKVVYPWDVIPDIYRQWYRAVFDQGKRLPPPGDLHGVVIVIPTVRTIGGTNNLDIAELVTFPADIRGVWESFGAMVVSTDGGVYLDQRQRGPSGTSVVVAFTPKMNRAVAIHPVQGAPPQMTNLTDGQDIEFGVNADQVMTTNGRVYIKAHDKVLEVILTEVGNKVIASTKLAANVLPQASKLFEGGAIQDLLGATYVSLFPRSGVTFQSHFEELDGYKVVDAKYHPAMVPGCPRGGVLMVLGAKKGQYDRLIFRFGRVMEYDVRVVEDVVPTGLNFVVLDTNVCVSLTEEEKLELFSVRMGSTQVKVIEDQMLGGDMTLGTQGGRVTFSRGNKVYRMKMR